VIAIVASVALNNDVATPQARLLRPAGARRGIEKAVNAALDANRVTAYRNESGV
jgi:hypothetical protein